MVNIQSVIEGAFKDAICAAYPTISDPPVPVLPAKQFADYQCNSAMALSKVILYKIIMCSDLCCNFLRFVDFSHRP